MNASAVFRRFFSSEGRAINALVVVGTAGLLGWGAWYVIWGSPTAGRVGLLVIGLLIAMFLLSGRFSAKFVRTVLALGIVVVLTGLVQVGREEIKHRRFQQARAAATALAGQIDETTAAGPAAAVSDAKKALQKLQNLTDASPKSRVLLQVRRVAADLEAVLGRRPDDPALAKIRRRIGSLGQGALARQAKQAADAVTGALAATQSAQGRRQQPRTRSGSSVGQGEGHWVSPVRVSVSCIARPGHS